MAKRGARSRSFEKRITTRYGAKVIAQKKQIKFSRSKRFAVKDRKETNQKNIKNFFDLEVRSRFKDYVKKKKGKKDYILRLGLQKNLKGKRIKGGFSLPRVEGLSANQVDMFLDIYLERLLLDLDEYLKRKDLKSLTISEIEFEVLKPDRKRKKSAKKVRTIRRSKR